MTTETDENQEQSKTAHIQDHLNQLLAAEDNLTSDDSLQKDKIDEEVHKEKGDEKQGSSSLRQRFQSGLRSFLTDEDEKFRLPTPSEVKEWGQVGAGTKEWRLPQITDMERQGLLTISGLIVVAGLLGFLVSPWGSISTYKVTGNQEVPKTKLLTELGLDKNQSALLLLSESSSLTKKAHAIDPQIQEVKLSIQSPTTMKVKVTEIPSVGYILDGKKYVPLLADGTRLKNDATEWPKDSFPIYSGFKSDKALDDVLASFGTLSLALRQSVSEVIWSPTNENAHRLIFVMNDGNQVLANAENFETKFKYYPGMATQLKKNGVIDLQVGAYAKPY